MSYLSKYTGARIDEILDKCDEYPTAQELNDVLQEMQDADVASLYTSGAATTRTVRVNLAGGVIKSVQLPAATTAEAGMMSAADKGTLEGLDRLAGVAMPLYMEGLTYVAGNGYLSGSGTGTELFGNGSSVTLTASDTGLRKKVYDRFKAGVPTCLLVPVCSSASDPTPVSAAPYSLVESSVVNAGGRATLRYRNALRLYGREDSDLDITVSVTGSNVTLAWTITAREEPGDTGPLLPFLLGHFSVNADGTVSPSSSAVAYGASSTGELKRLYERMQKGNPPSVGVMMTNTDGSQTVAWAHPDQITGSGKTRIYLSGTLANGTFSGKQLRVNISADKVMCSLVNASS